MFTLSVEMQWHIKSDAHSLQKQEMWCFLKMEIDLNIYCDWKYSKHALIPLKKHNDQNSLFACSNLKTYHMDSESLQIRKAHGSFVHIYFDQYIYLNHILRLFLEKSVSASKISRNPRVVQWETLITFGNTSEKNNINTNIMAKIVTSMTHPFWL